MSAPPASDAPRRPWRGSCSGEEGAPPLRQRDRPAHRDTRRVDGHLVFPDFALHPRGQPAQRWLLEIVGYWTPTYLATKLQRLREARIPNLLLCVDEERNVGEGDLPEGARVVRYRRRVDPRLVLEAMGTPPSAERLLPNDGESGGGDGGASGRAEAPDDPSWRVTPSG